MAIAKVREVNGSFTETSTLTFAVDGTSGTALYVTLQSNSGDTVTGVTYAGNAMTQISKVGFSGKELYLYFINSPTTGSNNVVASMSGASEVIGSAVVYSGTATNISYTGGSPTDNFNQNTVTSTSITVSATTVSNSSWMISVANITGGPTPTGGTNTTVLSTASHDQMLTTSSEGALTPAGSFSQSISWAGSVSAGMVVATISPTAAAGPANMKTWNGLATASIKTMNGLAIASVKTWNGLT